MSRFLEAHLDTWSSIGVCGHFRDLEDSPLKPWQLLSEQAASQMSRLVGASPEEVAAMGTLTVNLHLLLASFYTPSQSRRKILLDWKAFPSDHVGRPSDFIEFVRTGDADEHHSTLLNHKSSGMDTTRTTRWC